MKPSPVPCGHTQDADEASARRRLDCARATTCCHLAVANRWPAFACPTGLACYVPPVVIETGRRSWDPLEECS